VAIEQRGCHDKLKLRAAVMHDILDMMPESVKQTRPRQSYSTNQKCGDGVRRKVPGMPTAIENVLLPRPIGGHR
jgi:pre-mRNA-processing factor 8